MIDELRPVPRAVTLVKAVVGRFVEENVATGFDRLGVSLG